MKKTASISCNLRKDNMLLGFDIPNFLDLLEGSYGLLYETGTVLLFVLIFNFIVPFIFKRLKAHFLKKKSIWPLTFVTALDRPLYYYVWLFAGISIVDIVSDALFSFHLINMHFIFSVGSVTAFGWFLLRWNSAIMNQMMLKSQNHEINMTVGKVDLVSKIGTVVVIFITIFLMMDATGRNMQTLIAFGGIGGLALAFASQQVISNFFGGTMVYLTQPFSIGEHVILPEKKIEGHIEEIGWYLTRIRSLEKRPIYVPNSIFSQTIVMTPSRKSHERFKHTIGLRYDDVNSIKDIVTDIKLMLLKHPHVDQHQKIDVHFIGFNISSLDIEVSAYSASTCGSYYPDVRQELLLAIADIISKRGAEIATPTNVVQLQGTSLNQLISSMTKQSA